MLCSTIKLEMSGVGNYVPLENGVDAGAAARLLRPHVTFYDSTLPYCCVRILNA